MKQDNEVEYEDPLWTYEGDARCYTSVYEEQTEEETCIAFDCKVKGYTV